jgi:hypothetical protein
LVVGAAVLVVGTQAGAAPVICQKKSGVVVIRDPQCKKKETALDLAQFGALGPQGDKGDKGDQGDPGPLLTTLPSGATLRGAYSWAGRQTTGYSPTYAISYQFPLAATPVLNVIDIGGGGTTECPGTSADPQAAAGNLCVYQTRNDSGNTVGAFNEIEGGLFGAVLFSSVPDNTDFQFNGTWAVTAP